MCHIIREENMTEEKSNVCYIPVGTKSLLLDKPLTMVIVLSNRFEEMELEALCTSEEVIAAIHKPPHIEYSPQFRKAIALALQGAGIAANDYLKENIHSILKRVETEYDPRN